MKNSISNITMQQLNVFFAVVESNGFANASIDLHLTQSAVSKSIAKLEQELNIQLFNRTTRELRLTQAGTLLYKNWKQQTFEMNQSLQRALSIQEDLYSTLRIGFLNTARPERYLKPPGSPI